MGAIVTTEDSTTLSLAETTSDGRARSRALKSTAGGQVEPTGRVAFRSAGRLLILGEEGAVREAESRLAGTLDVTTLVRRSQACDVGFQEADGGGRLTAMPAELSGHFGQFHLTFETLNGKIDLKAATGGCREHFDLVLDLSETPLIQSAILPIGYFAPGAAVGALDEALEELPGLVGEFEKPQYFQYDPSICAHSRSGIQACSRCLDTCPAEAIKSIGDQVEVDASLCQGAGVCATACPTGAIRYAYPGLGDSLDRVRRLLKSFREAGGARARLLFYSAEGGAEMMAQIAARLPENVLPLEVEEVGSVGMDVWLSGLAYGAAQVCLLADPATPASVLVELEAQLTYAHAILEGMGFPRQLISLVQAGTGDQAESALGEPAPAFSVSPAGFAGVNEKRTMLRLAIDLLYEQAPARRPLVSLPTGAPFGEVTVDEGRCTLCMACVSQCPGKALEAGGEEPQLKFIEENCVQCALCARTCPENAIAPSPRYLFDLEQRRARRVLKEEQAFHCVSCGKPFSTRSMIENMTAKLRSHPMFKGAGLRRLQMCEDCRVRAMYVDELLNLDTGGGEEEQQ